MDIRNKNKQTEKEIKEFMEEIGELMRIARNTPQGYLVFDPFLFMYWRIYKNTKREVRREI